MNEESSGVLTLGTNASERLRIDSSGSVTANVDLRAPIFYDSNNTAYYVDPNSTGLSLSSNGIVSSGTGVNGGFQNRTYTGGRNRIWSFGNADGYGISYFQGGPDYIGLHVSGNPTQANSDFWVSSAGISQTSQSSRAPIFYDSDNTAYYVNPNGTSVLSNLNATGTGHVFGSSSNVATTVTLRATNTAGAPAHTATLSFEGYEGRGQGTFHTDVSYAGQEWFSGIPYASGFSVFQIGYDAAGGQAEYGANSIARFTNAGDFQMGTTTVIDSSRNFYGATFYDSDNTGYYVNPLNTSVMNVVTIGGSGGGFISRNVGSQTGSLWLAAASSGTGGANTVSLAGGATTYMNANSTGIDVLGSIEINGTTAVDSSRNLTNIGNITSTADNSFLSMGVAGAGSTVGARFLSIEGNTDTSGEGSGRIFFTEHNSTTASMDNYGMSIGYRGGADIVEGASGNTWDGLSQIGNGEWGMWGHNNSASGSLIMYGDRAASFINFAGNGLDGVGRVRFSDTSPTLQEDGNYLRIQTSSGWTSIGSGNSSWTHFFTDRGGFYFGTRINVNGEIKVYNSNTRLISTGAYAPAFYDSDDTAFYVNPASTSVMNTVYIGGSGGGYISRNPGSQLGSMWIAAGSNGTGGGNTVVLAGGNVPYVMADQGGTSITGDLTPSGTLYLDNPNNSSTNDPNIDSKGELTSGTAYSYHALFKDGNGVIKGRITHNQYGAQFSNLSDYRAKEDYQEVENATSRLMSIPVRNFQWIGSDLRTDGFLAHEIAEVVPEAVVGEKDAVLEDGTPDYQSIDQSKIVPLLVKTIQELEARITALENA
jgi:hypothetical protein